MSAAPVDEESAPLRLVDQLLAEQQQLTAVERFAQKHEDTERPAQARYYRDLIPSSKPGAGEQYAFAVDLDACTGCKACVTACHSLNGLEAEETWRDVGLLVGGGPAAPIQQTVTTACHHCEDPGCLSGCPVRAYEKDPITGIVRHLDDQCIGCQYCVMKCPYDVPKYDASKGIVRKCDMCTDRLTVGEAPACVQGCPNGAIAIEIVDLGGGQNQSARLLPVASGAMPESSYTRPTTRYRTRRDEMSNLVPADLHEVRPSDPHTPLAVMLVLVQLSLGAFVSEQLLGLLSPHASLAGGTLLRGVIAVVAAAAALLGLGAANLHLGRPQFAFRVVLGLRTSWMSREIVVFGGYAGLAVAYAASWWVGAASALVPWLAPLASPAAALRPWLGAATVAIGALGVFCSAMIYVDTRREFWSMGRTLPRFLASVCVLGPPSILLCGYTASAFVPTVAPMLPAGIVFLTAGVLALASLGKLFGELRVLRHLAEPGVSTLKRSAMLLRGPLRGRLALRGALGALGGVVLPALLTGTVAFGVGSSGGLALIALAMAISSLGGELLARHLFFAGVASRAMPGQ